MKNTLKQTFLKAEIQTDIGKIFKRLEKEIKADEQNEGHVSDAQIVKNLWEMDIDEYYDTVVDELLTNFFDEVDEDVEEEE